jgi:hypothetical protein
MEKIRSRVDDLSNLILNVTNREGGNLNLSKMPGSQLKTPEKFLRNVPVSFRNNGSKNSLACGLDYFSPGMTVVILGGKNYLLNYIAARDTAPHGLVINCFPDTSGLEKLQAAFGQLPGNHFPDLRFYYTPNGDLETRYAEIEKFLKKNSVDNTTGYLQLEKYISGMKSNNPLIEDNSVDIATLDGPNFEIASEALWDLAADVYRILKKGGIFLFSLLLSDEKAVEEGYLCEDDMERFTHSLKFHGLHCLGRSELPYQVINGKEIRCHNFAAFKGKEGPCMERRQAVIYNGPWREIKDDDGHTYSRGKRAAVCDKTFKLLSSPPYQGQFTYLYPYIDIPLEQAAPFPCGPGTLFRHPKETKGVIEVNPASQDGRDPADDGCGPADSTVSTESCCDPDDDGSGCC